MEIDNFFYEEVAYFHAKVRKKIKLQRIFIL